MAMNMGPSADPAAAAGTEVMSEINTTPLIDVMLVLLIMLIITIPVQLHAVNLTLPQGAPPPRVLPPEVVRIDVDADGTLTWNGSTVAAQDIEPRLRELAAQPDQPEVHLRPHKAVAYERVTQVLAAAQRVGVTKLGVTGYEQFVE